MTTAASLLVQDYVDRAAARRGDAVAVTLEDERMTYAELAQLSDRLAAQLVDAGCEPGDRVGILMPKQPLAIVAIQAALKAGCVYVPLDAGSPPVRLGRIVETAQLRVLLAAPDTALALDALARETVLPPLWSIAREPIAGELASSRRTRVDWDADAPPPAVRVEPDDPAYLLFTSGSTGWPKGVVITHRNVTTFSDWAVREFAMEPGDRMSNHPSLHFDLSTFDLHPTFAAGGELHMVPPSLSVDARGVAAFIRDRELTQWCSVPSLLTYLARFDAVAQDDFPALKRITWCGEALPPATLAHWMRRLPHVRFTNMYGPTEATCASSYFHIPEVPADESVPTPIGRPCAGEELLVLDDGLRLAAPGEVGEIAIAGAGVSPGYWRDEAKTRAAFVPDPRAPQNGGRVYRTGDLGRVDADGLFHYVGRADSQIKSRGYRIELGEIESALGAAEGVGECAAVGVPAEGFEGLMICAAFVADQPLAPAALRGALAATLPSYMIPSRWQQLDALPKNQNGKIDRRGVRELFTRQLAARAAGGRA